MPMKRSPVHLVGVSCFVCCKILSWRKNSTKALLMHFRLQPFCNFLVTPNIFTMADSATVQQKAYQHRHWFIILSSYNECIALRNECLILLCKFHFKIIMNIARKKLLGLMHAGDSFGQCPCKQRGLALLVHSLQVQ